MSFWAVLAREDILAVVSDETLRVLNAWTLAVEVSMVRSGDRQAAPAM